MEVLLCGRGGHPNLCAGRMGGPWKYNNSSFFIFRYVNTLHIHTFMTPLHRCIYLDLSCISWSSPESQWGISFQQLKEKKNCRLFFSTTSNFNKAVTTRKAHERKKIGFHSSPFSGGPWLLVWGKVEGWVCISGFCQLSSFGFHQWTEAMKREYDSNSS